MAYNAISEGEVVWVKSGNTVVVDIDTGANAGERWVVRDDFLDAWQIRGDQKPLGQGAREALSGLVAANGGRVWILQDGLDQFGRLVGDLRDSENGTNWSVAMNNQGQGEIGNFDDQGAVVVISWPERRSGTQLRTPLTVDKSVP